MYLQLFIDGRYGSFSTNKLEKSDLQKFISQGIAATRFISPDPFRKLPEKSLYYRGEDIDLGQNDYNFTDINPERKREIAKEIINNMDRSDSRIISIGSSFDDLCEDVYMVDSNGFEGRTKQTLYTVSAECSVKDSDSRPEGWWYDSTMFLDKLNHQDCGKIALSRALNKLGSRQIKSGKYNIILENTVSSKVISPIISALHGSSIQQMSSFLINSRGKKLFPEFMSLKDTPHKYGAMGSRLFDSERIATKDFSIIENGVVCTYFINTYYAGKMNEDITIEGPSVPALTSNLPLRTGLSEHLKRVGKGVLISGFNGGNSNPVTGDFSYGIEGFYFENGEILHPVSEMNLTGNIISLWNKLLFIGNDHRECSRWQIPTLSFESININGE